MRWKPPGIANARERAGLIEYLDGLGFTAEDMVEAERRGRLFGLAGDVLQWSGLPTYSLRTAAEALGVPVEDVAHAWAVLGLTVAGPDDARAEPGRRRRLGDVGRRSRTLVGDDAALGLLRVLGAAMARLAEASGDDGPPRAARHPDGRTAGTSSPPRGHTAPSRSSSRASAH